MLDKPKETAPAKIGFSTFRRWFASALTKLFAGNEICALLTIIYACGNLKIYILRAKYMQTYTQAPIKIVTSVVIKVLFWGVVLKLFHVQ